MKHTPCDSSLLKSYAFENGIFEAMFPNGARYKYPVNQELHEKFLKSESKGKFFNAFIKPLGGTRVDSTGM
jgi:hypothetical protein